MPRHASCLIPAALAAAMVSACASDVTGGPRAASDYEARLADYARAYRAYQAEADAYWEAVAEKRRLRNAKRRAHEPITLADYVLTQPPVYAGPPKPVDPNAPPAGRETQPEVPLVADFLRAAAEQWHFVPEQPASETEFKRAYAQAALAAGLTPAQAVGVYSFETGGNGGYATQAGVTPTRVKAISPALGYNQLLSTNTLSLLAEDGDRFVAALAHKAASETGARRRTLERKVGVLRRMVAFARRIPPRWSDYDRVAKTTPQGLGIHAILLDIDIGPLLQAQKLANSIAFARAKGHAAPLSAAELELMNLTGDGNGLDMVTMPQAMREQVPTANFFQPGGYTRNPIAQRARTVAGLLAAIESHMRRNAAAPGARELAAAF